MGWKLLCIFASVKAAAPGLGWLAEEADSLFDSLPISVNVATNIGIWVLGLVRTAGANRFTP